MADAKPSKIHGDDSHDNIPTADAKPTAREALKVLNVSGKAVNLVAEYEVGQPDAKGNKTIRRDYE
jgi:hypothetical protein